MRTHDAWIPCFGCESPLKFDDHQTGVKDGVVSDNHNGDATICDAESE